MSSSVGQAKAALGSRLRELRRNAGQSGKQLAITCGWHPSKITRIELGQQQPTENDLLAWCRATDSMLAYDDLVATARNIHSMYLEWRRIVASGRAHRQRQSLQIEHGARHIRWYESWVVPGLLQTSDYARAILTSCRALIPSRDDIDEAVALRMRRQRILDEGTRRFSFLVAEAALRQQIGSPQIMIDQLHKLIERSGNLRIDLGIIPAEKDTSIGSHGFAMFDRESVMVETLSAELTITRPSEIAIYDDVYAGLHKTAVRGPTANDLIAQIAIQHAP